MPSTILVTGGAGTLGRALAPLLAENGYRVRLFDLAPVELTGAQYVQGDVRERRDVERAVAGADALVHTAAWHGIHLSDHSAAEFWALNVEGSRVVYESALAAGISRAIFSSTMGVYGESRGAAPDSPAVRVHERLPLLPGDIYGLSKVIGEELVAYHDRATRLKGIALRYGMFVPVPFAHYGVRLLYGGVDARDVAAAVLASLRRLERGDSRFAAYNVESAVPFTEADGRDLRTDPLAAIARHWPDAPELLARLGPRPWNDPREPGGGLTPLCEVFEIERARQDLGWVPRYNFDQFLEGLRWSVSQAEQLVPATA